MTRIPTTTPPIGTSHPARGPAISVTLDQLLVNTEWVTLARQLPHRTTIVVQILRKQPYSAARLRSIGIILAEFGHRLIIDQEGEPLQEATSL